MAKGQSVMNNHRIMGDIFLKQKCIMLMFIAIIVPTQSFSHQFPFNKSSEDAFEELGGNLTLSFFNALDGNPIPRAAVKISSIGEYISNVEGKIHFPVPEEDNVILKVSFRARGYIPSDFDIEIKAGTLFMNRLSVSPVLDIKHMRIVLDWGTTPSDLDAHFRQKNGYHISYHHKKVLEDGTGRLDRDDRNGFGPETITIKKISSQSEYEYFVHNYSDRKKSMSKNLSKSRATVKVFGEGKLLYFYRMPLEKKGNKWHVFNIIDKQIVEVNEIY